jgi:hypothetical protein
MQVIKNQQWKSQESYENNTTHCDAAASTHTAHWHHDNPHMREDSGTGDSWQQAPELTTGLPEEETHISKNWLPNWKVIKFSILFEQKLKNCLLIDKGLLCMVTEAWEAKFTQFKYGVLSILFKTTSVLPLKKKGKKNFHNQCI